MSKFLWMLDRKTGLTNNKLGFPLSCLALSRNTLHMKLAQKNHAQAQHRQKLTAEEKSNIWSADT